jgi:hypothetical protein
MELPRIVCNIHTKFSGNRSNCAIVAREGDTFFFFNFKDGQWT